MIMTHFYASMQLSVDLRKIMKYAVFINPKC